MHAGMYGCMYECMWTKWSKSSTNQGHLHNGEQAHKLDHEEALGLSHEEVRVKHDQWEGPVDQAQQEPNHAKEEAAAAKKRVADSEA